MSRNIILVMYIQISENKLIYFIKSDSSSCRFYELMYLFIAGICLLCNYDDGISYTYYSYIASNDRMVTVLETV
jgi:hypothetical protein